MNIVNKIILDVVNLERKNMTPILNEHGKSFQEKDVLKDIAQNNSQLYNLFCDYSSDDKLKGYFRYNFDSNKNIVIKSIQLSSTLNTAGTLRKFLYIGYRHLNFDVLNEGTKIYAWVNVRNENSIKLLEKLNFQYVNGHRDASKFSTTKKALLKKLEELNINRLYSSMHYKGNFPTRVLKPDMLSYLISHRSGIQDKIKHLVRLKKISDRINIDESEKFGLIYARGDTKDIFINEQFMAFLWGFIYSTFVIFEEGVHSKIQKHGAASWDGQIDYSRPIVSRAVKLFKWVISLPKKYTEWPIYLPNPEVFYSAEEQIYIEKAKVLYLKSMVYLINHEIAHLVNNHHETLNTYDQKGIDELSENERLNYVSIEGEADLYAREELVMQDDDEISKLINGLSIILSHCASLFTVGHPKFLNSKKHPDIDNRIFNSINHLNLSNQDSKDYIYLAGAISFTLFFHLTKEELEIINFDLMIPKATSDPESYFYSCLNKLDNIKAKYKDFE